MRRWHTPPQVADQLVVAPEKVIGWIEAGKLVAVNVSEGKLRPRYRISPEALADFLRARQAPGPAPRPARRKKPAAVKEFF